MKKALMMLALVAALPAAAQQLVDGEIRKVDKEARKLTIKHGPIPSLDMPPMTMAFRVKDPSVLKALKQGDKVRFAAERTDGQYMVTRIEKAK